MDAATQHTFQFADLVGYTAITERIGDDAAADVAVAFQAAAAHMASKFECEVVKNLGDAVMVRGEGMARQRTDAPYHAHQQNETTGFGKPNGEKERTPRGRGVLSDRVAVPSLSSLLRRAGQANVVHFP